MTKRSVADDIREELPRRAMDAATRKALEEWLASDREFNEWFLVTTKRALADDELMELLDGYRESQETVERAWKTFRDDGDESKLEASIAISGARMQTLMNG